MATVTKIDWNGGALAKKLSSVMRSRLGKVAEKTADQLRENISTPTAIAGPSQEGEFPHADTFELYKSVYAVVENSGDDLSAIVGTGFFGSAPYAEFVEESRPHVERTLNEMMPYIKRELTKPVF